MKCIIMITMLLVLTYATTKRVTTKDLNVWGQQNCRLSTQQEEFDSDNENRWFPTTKDTTCKGRDDKKCRDSAGCAWSKVKNKCVSYCYACYYITDKKDNTQYKLKKDADDEWPVEGNLYIILESYKTGGRNLLTKELCKKPKLNTEYQPNKTK